MLQAARAERRSGLACWAHNPKVRGTKPCSTTLHPHGLETPRRSSLQSHNVIGGAPNDIGMAAQLHSDTSLKLNRNVALRGPGNIMLRPIRGHSALLLETCEFDISFRLHSDMSSPGGMLSNNIPTTCGRLSKTRRGVHWILNPAS